MLSSWLNRWISRKTLLIALMLMLAVSNGLAALSAEFSMLLGARAVGALAHGVFWAIVAASAAVPGGEAETAGEFASIAPACAVAQGGRQGGGAEDANAGGFAQTACAFQALEQEGDFVVHRFDVLFDVFEGAQLVVD